MKHGEVFVGNGLYDNYYWGSIARLADGRLAVATSGQRLAHICPFGKNVIVTSEDEGETWSEQKVIVNGPLDDRDVGLTPLADGGYLLTNFTISNTYQKERIDTRSHMDTEEKKQLAREQVERVTKEVELANLGSYCYTFDKDDNMLRRVNIPLTAPHGFSVMNNGLFGMVGTRYFDSYLDVVDGRDDLPRRGIGFITTPDGLHFSPITWIDLPELAEEREFCEPHMIQLKSGRILVTIRVELDHTPEDKDMTLYMCVSDDGGKTFSMPKPIEGPDGRVCGAPPHLLQTEDGTVILTYGRRVKPYGECARLSRDGGETWSDEIVLRDDAPKWDLGYPSSVQLKDGEILTVYYQIPNGSTNRAILSTKWDYKDYI